MSEVTRKEFESLKRQVRTLERTVDEQQKQIATLKRRTSTDLTDESGSSKSDSQTKVPRSTAELNVLDTLEEHNADEKSLSVDLIKNQAAQAGLLRSQAKSVLRKWLDEGYLTGDIEESVQVVEWPSRDVPVGDR